MPLILFLTLVQFVNFLLTKWESVVFFCCCFIQIFRLVSYSFLGQFFVLNFPPDFKIMDGKQRYFLFIILLGFEFMLRCCVDLSETAHWAIPSGFTVDFLSFLYGNKKRSLGKTMWAAYIVNVIVSATYLQGSWFKITQLTCHFW